MHYIQPQITGTFPALSAIKSDKNEGIVEGSSHQFTNGAAYQADE
jgi:hypothetical protein